MASVTFPVELGGDGSTVTDDANPITGLRNGGWRTRFVPCLTNTVAIANEVATRTIFGSDTSVTSNSIGVGSKVFATAGLLRWAAGMYVTVARTSAPTASNMYGQVTAYNAFTSQVTINITNVVGSGTFTDWTIAIAPPGLAAFSFTGATTIAVNSTSDALRVTQTGTGNALVVEDSANPDATPFVIDTDGNVGIGAVPLYKLYVKNGYSVIGAHNTTTIPNSNTSGGVGVYWNRSSGSAETNLVNLYDNAGVSFEFAQKTGAATQNLLLRMSSSDFQVYTNNTERMRIDNGGRVGIGRTPGNDGTLYVTGSPVNAYSYNINNAPTYGSTVTSEGVGYIATVNTAAAAFTLNAVQHYRVAQGTKGAGSTITNLVGYHCDPLTNGTSNYGFYSTVASGSGRYNFYAAGTADNYFAGNTYTASGTTTMTSGFFYIPSAAGAPSGVPTAIAGRVPMYYDTTNNNFYVYNGAWKKVLLA